MARPWLLMSSVAAVLFAVYAYYFDLLEEDDGTPACTSRSHMSTTVLYRDPVTQNPLVIYIENFITDSEVMKLKETAYAIPYSNSAHSNFA